MSFPQTTFRADCVAWKGYEPCTIQKAENRPDCFGCEHYEAGPEQLDIKAESFNPLILKEADALGIVEMGGLGSVLRATAVTLAIRKINPNVNITWFTHERGANLLKYVPGVSPIDVGKTSPADQRRLVTGLDALINYELNDQANDLVAHAKQVGGFTLNNQGRFHGVYPYAEYLQRIQIDDAFRKQNCLTMQQILLRSIGLVDQEAQYDVSPEESNYRRADETLNRAFNGSYPERIIGLNIGASKKGELKRWPAERYATLAKRLGNIYPDIGVVILSGPEDGATLEKVSANLEETPPNIKVLPGNLEIGDFLALVNRLNLVITADTFGMHAARSQNVQTIALTGPMPHRELELTSEDILIGPKLGCSPCYNHCSFSVAGQCMSDISVEEVLEQVHRLSKSQLLIKLPASRT